MMIKIKIRKAEHLFPQPSVFLPILSPWSWNITFTNLQTSPVGEDITAASDTVLSDGNLQRLVKKNLGFPEDKWTESLLLFIFKGWAMNVALIRCYLNITYSGNCSSLKKDLPIGLNHCAMKAKYYQRIARSLSTYALSVSLSPHFLPLNLFHANGNNSVSHV